MRHASSARRIGLGVAVTAALMLTLGAGAQADVCEGFDCVDAGELVSGPRVQYAFSTFSLCTDCLSERPVRTAYIGDAEHPANPAHPPNPAIALAQGKLLAPGDNGAEQIHAIGRIYQDGARYLFDGHLVPGAQQYPPTPAINSLTFRGIIFQWLIADLAISQRPSPRPGCPADPVNCPIAFAITVTNQGGSAANNAVVTATTSRPTTSVSRIATTQGSCEALSSASFSCTLGSLAPGENATITVELGTGCPWRGFEVTSTATVTSDTYERRTGNNASVFTNRCGSTSGGGGGGSPA